MHATSEFIFKIITLIILMYPTGGLDFIGVLNHQLSFTPTMTSHTVLIEITNDDIYEDEAKHFTVSLFTNEVRVHLRNMSTIVNIIDDDSGYYMCIYIIYIIG